jgi:pimeloyl-ACP methyl ester carboxylesterase
MTEPRWIEVSAPTVQLRALSWGPDDGPIALCLHGFPDTAYGFRKLAPHLVAAGYRVVAPFMRGYVPSSIPADGSYHIGAVMADALQVRAACGPTDSDVIIGHDWGAIAATGLAAMPNSPFVKAVVMSVPPSAALRPRAGKPLANRGRLLRLLPRQVLRSWYISYFQLPFLPERSSSWIVPLLWRRWSPGYNAAQDLRHVDAAIGSPDRWRAALGTYRATIRNTRPPARYVELHSQWLEAPRLPTLYLHGDDDGCMTPEFTPWVAGVLPPGSDVAIVERAGHFLQLEQPDVVGERIVEFLAATSS